ncbi:hypothetical protein [Hydrogenophaga sp.]
MCTTALAGAAASATDLPQGQSALHQGQASSDLMSRGYHLVSELKVTNDGGGRDADPGALPDRTDGGHLVRRYTYELGVTTHTELYEEFGTSNQKIMQEKGALIGVKGAVTRHLGPDRKLIVAGEIAMGESDYTGSFIGGNYGELRFNGQSRYLLDVSVAYKQSIPQWSDVAFSAGVGYRRLTDNLQEAGPAGYQRVNDRIYLALGVEKPFHSGNWTISPGLNYRSALWGNQYSALSGGLDKKQKDASGFELYVNFAHKPSRITLTPFLRTWSADDSEVTRGFYEPRNDTREVGVALTYRF